MELSYLSYSLYLISIVTAILAILTTANRNHLDIDEYLNRIIFLNILLLTAILTMLFQVGIKTVRILEKANLL